MIAAGHGRPQSASRESCDGAVDHGRRRGRGRGPPAIIETTVGRRYSPGSAPVWVRSTRWPGGTLVERHFMPGDGAARGERYEAGSEPSNAPELGDCIGRRQEP